VNYSTQDVSYSTQDTSNAWAGNVLSAALVVLAFFIIYAVSRAPKLVRTAAPSRRNLRKAGISIITPKGVQHGRKKR